MRSMYLSISQKWMFGYIVILLQSVKKCDTTLGMYFICLPLLHLLYCSLLVFLFSVFCVGVPLNNQSIYLSVFSVINITITIINDNILNSILIIIINIFVISILSYDIFSKFYIMLL